MTRIRLGFIGAGWWATTNHMPLLAARHDVELVGACGLDEAVLQKLKMDFALRVVTKDYQELLHSGLDGVIVTTPHSAHFEHAYAALSHGCHVLCEKPLTLHADQAWRLVELARLKDRQLLVPYGWHYKPFVQRAKALMEAGSVGTVEYVLCHMASPTKAFFSGKTQAPIQWKAKYAEPSLETWQVAEMGGGYGHGQVTHSAALMFWLTGLRARAVSSRMASPNSQVDMYNAATVTYDSGAIGTISGAATLPDQDKFQLDLRIFGSDGALLLDVERERLELRRHDGRHQSFDIPAGEGAYTCDGPPNRFVDLIQGRGRNDSPGEVAARTVELIEAMYLSAKQQGTPVSIA